MRAALISLAEVASHTGGAVRIAGQSLAHHQCAFALAAGCERIVAIGDGASQDAIALGHFVERAGAKFQTIANSRGLLGSARAGDELLVIAPSLIPEATLARDLLAGSPALLVLPSAPGAAAGFERIDRERTWAGAMVLPGPLLERLSELPADVEAAPALLRIALQAGLKERALPESVLDDGSWAMAHADNGPALERTRLERLLPPLAPHEVTKRVAAIGLRRFHASAFASPSVPALAWGAAATGATAGVLLPSAGYVSAGFVAIAVAALSAAFAAAVVQLRFAPWRSLPPLQERWAGLAIDGAIVACGALGIAGDGLHRLFPPLVLLAALHAAPPAERVDGFGLLGDRGMLALILAFAAAFGGLEPVIMALAVLTLGLAWFARTRRRG